MRARRGHTYGQASVECSSGLDSEAEAEAGEEWSVKKENTKNGMEEWKQDGWSAGKKSQQEAKQRCEKRGV